MVKDVLVSVLSVRASSSLQLGQLVTKIPDSVEKETQGEAGSKGGKAGC